MNKYEIMKQSNENLLIDKFDFDYLGTMHLKPDELNSFNNAKDILNYICTVSNDTIILRNSKYYQDMGRTEILEYDKALYQLYQQVEKNTHDKHALYKILFSVMEHRINLGQKVYYSLFEDALETDAQEALEFAKKRIDEDYRTLVGLMHGNLIEKPDKNSFEDKIDQNITITGRQVEMDHKYLLFSRARNLWIENVDYPAICSPLLGGIEIPFMFRACFECLNNLFSSEVNLPETAHILYGEHDNKRDNGLMKGQVSAYEKLGIILPKHLHKDFLKNDKILVMDDNVGTGKTMETLSGLFSDLFDTVHFGFIELSWKHLNDIRSKEKEGQHFNINAIKYPTFGNYRHHSTLDSLIDCIKTENLEGYFEILGTLNMNIEYLSASECLLLEGFTKAISNKEIIDDTAIKHMESMLALDMHEY